MWDIPILIFAYMLFRGPNLEFPVYLKNHRFTVVKRFAGPGPAAAEVG